MLDRIHSLGMSPTGSKHSEPITLKTGEELGVVHEPGDTYCLEMGGLAARYSGTELETLGDGDRVVGLVNVIHAVQESPEYFERGDTRPLHDLFLIMDQFRS
jgi:hypothetical protein